MGLHTGEPSVADEGYLGLDVVRAARICWRATAARSCSRRRRGRSSGTTCRRAWRSSTSGQQRVKDVQHERIFQLALEGDESFPPLKTETPKSSSDALAERIERHVEGMIEQSFTGLAQPKPKAKPGKGA